MWTVQTDLQQIYPKSDRLLDSRISEPCYNIRRSLLKFLRLAGEPSSRSIIDAFAKKLKCTIYRLSRENGNPGITVSYNFTGYPLSRV
jgi:hypothetical protein